MSSPAAAQPGRAADPRFLVVGGGKMGASHLVLLNRLLDVQQVALVDPSRLTRFVYGTQGFRTFASPGVNCILFGSSSRAHIASNLALLRGPAPAPAPAAAPSG